MHPRQPPGSCWRGRIVTMNVTSLRVRISLDGIPPLGWSSGPAVLHDGGPSVGRGFRAAGTAPRRGPGVPSAR